MLTPEKIERLNALARKKKSEGLTPEEITEQQALRQEYLANLRYGMRNHIEGMKIVDEEGTDVTPDKLKQIQKEKHIHNRHLEQE